jgi:phosphoserine phosphatase
VLALPVSSTGLAGFISLRTLQLVQQLRSAGHRFVIISGMRVRAATATCSR